MSRDKTDTTVDMGDLESVEINHNLKDFTCAITGQILFDPVMTHCGQHIERSASSKLQKCPCCNGSNIQFNDPSAFFKTTLQKMIQQYRLYENVYFDLEGFKQAVAKNQLNTPIGERLLTLLQNSGFHLNNKELIRTETQVTHPVYLEIPQVTVVETKGKSPIEILAETLAGRDLLRKKLKIEASSGKYFFGNAEISSDSLQIQVHSKSICEWLSITTAMEKMEKDALERMAVIENEAHIIMAQKEMFSNHQFRLFLSQGAQSSAAAAGFRMHSEAMQNVAYGKENKVRDALESVKSDPAQLAALLSFTGTVKDYSDRTITGMTLLQAAAAAGDIDMCLMLKNYMLPKEFATQLDKIFPDGIEVHAAEQKKTAFNFDTILTAIQAANTPDLGAAFNKTDNGSALCRALEEFRRQFSKLSNCEEIFNPHHFLRVFEVHDAFLNNCERDGSDRDCKKRDLFWCQIIGYTQRFMPACYAQAFWQGLYYLVKVDQPDSWRPEAFKRDLNVRDDNVSYFPLPLDSHSGLGFDFAIWFGCDDATAGDATIMRSPGRDLHFLKTFVGQKHQAFRTLCREFECGRASSLMNVTA